ncbi:MAG: PIG-L family deacetylase [Bacteroidetes bacterium]|nr:PIG-L family deacetylase [Bacteroidota bacterium]
MNLTQKSILILSPHTDDAELGCGGTIKLLLEQGNEVHIAAFSACRHSVLAGFPEDVLVQEIKASTRELGIPAKNLHLFDYDVRTFNFHRQEILDDILNLRHKIKPDVVFVPSVNDIHQDHYTIAQEAVRAFKFSTLLCYELPWNNFEFKTTLFFGLHESHVEQKIKALSNYKSQAHRAYMQPDFIRSLAKVRGVQVGLPYAEVFEVVRMIY